ncbi:MAG: chitin deacetylase family protein [Candidatus Krumholzibacteriia bacterium]|nr:polysaccharide deacetylase family protein [bacterium]
MKRSLKIGAAALLLLLVGAPALVIFPPRPLLDAVAKANPEVLFYVDTERPVVALTLDDGPDAQVTPRVLDLLARYGVHATFFLIGDRVPGNEALLARMRAEGHELANHMAHDEPSIGLSPVEFAHQLAEVDSLIGGGDEGAPGGHWLRPGSGWFNDRMIEQLETRGYRLALGSVYPHDLLLKSPALIADFVKERVFPGSVIILHDGDGQPGRTVDVLERVLPDLVARGYRFLTLTELNALGEVPAS